MAAAAYEQREARVRAWIAEGAYGDAAEALVRDYADDVDSLCRAMLRDPALAEDASQDVFARAFRALGAFRGESSLRTGLLRIARHRCIDVLRARVRAPDTIVDGLEALPDVGPDVLAVMVHRESLERGLEALKPEERAVVVLRFGRGLSYPEIAATFGLAQGAVRMRVSRAVQKMRDAISREPEARRLPKPARLPRELQMQAHPRTQGAAETRAVDVTPLPAPTPQPSVDEDERDTIPSPPPTWFSGGCSTPHLGDVKSPAAPGARSAPSGSSLRSRQSDADWFSGGCPSPRPCRSESGPRSPQSRSAPSGGSLRALSVATGDWVSESGVAATVEAIADALQEGSGPRRLASLASTREGDTVPAAPRLESEVPRDTIPAGPPSSMPVPSTVASVVTSLTEALRTGASPGLRRRLLELAALVP